MKEINPIPSHCPQHNICAVESPLWWYGYFFMDKQSKTCSRCKETKSINDFSKSKNAKDGLQYTCKDCTKKYYKKYYEENKNQIIKQKKNYRGENRDKVKEWSKRWREENPQKYKESQKNYYEKNKESRKNYYEKNKDRIIEQIKKYQEENKDKIKERRKKYENTDKAKKCKKEWLKNNRDKYNKLHREWARKNKEKSREYNQKWRKKNPKYYKNKRETNFLYKLSHNISISIKNSLERKGYAKNSKTYNILKIDRNDFYKWLNGEASNGLNYENDNVHIDHVIPVSLARTEDEALMLNHYSNLQLLSLENNISKNNNYIYKDNLNRVLRYHPDSITLNNIIERSKIKLV